MRTFLLAVLILIIGQFALNGVLGASCESCHSPSSSNPSGNWVYHPPVISLIHDPFYKPDTEFELRMFITGASDYEVRSLSADIDETDMGLTLISGEEGTLKEDEEGNPYIQWRIRTGDEGEFDIFVNVEYKVHYKHRNPGNIDEATYFDRVSTSILTADLDLSITPGTLIFEEVGEVREITLKATNPVSNITAVPHESLVDFISVDLETRGLQTGESAVIRIHLTNLTETISTLNISWIEGDQRREVQVEIVIANPGSGGGGVDILWEIGKYTGIIAFILVLTGYFTGGSSSLKETANKFFGSAKKRIKVHCILSFFTLLLVVLHFVTLFIGPFRDLILRWEVVLGWTALVIMMIVSVNGMFQKRFVKWMGFQNWRRIHAWGSNAIKILVIVHMLFYGTHFGWFRNLIGYG